MVDNSMEIKGGMNTADVDSGFARVANGFSQIRGEANSTNSDLTRMVITVDGLVDGFLNLAKTSGKTMIDLASQAPAVAPALAEMKVSMMELSFALGDALEPAFEAANDLLKDFTGWVVDHKDDIGGWACTLVDWMDTAGKAIGTFLDKWDKFKKSGPGGLEEVNIPGQGIATVGGAIAGEQLGGASGAAIGAAAGYSIFGEFENAIEVQRRVHAGQPGLEAMAQTYGPGIVGDFYSWLFDVIGISDGEIGRRESVMNQPDGAS